MKRPRLIALSLLVTGLVLAPSSAAAHTLLDDEELRLDVKALARAGYRVLDDAGTFSHEPYIGFARLAADARYEKYGRAVVQVAGETGDVRLLDVMAEIRPAEEIAVRAGRFKVPTSADFLIPAGQLPFVNRGQLVGLIQKRLTGVELAGEITADDGFSATAQVGWFQASEGARDLLPDGEGSFLSTRAAVALPVGLGFHVAYLSLVLADNAPGPAGRPVEFPEIVDAAVTYESGGWSVYLEGLVAPDKAAPTDDLSWGSYLHATYRFGVSDVIDLEPGARYGLVSRAGVVTHRSTAGFTTHVVGTPLHARANYELALREELVGHAGYLQLQAGF